MHFVLVKIYYNYKLKTKKIKLTGCLILTCKSFLTFTDFVVTNFCTNTVNEITYVNAQTGDYLNPHFSDDKS